MAKRNLLMINENSIRKKDEEKQKIYYEYHIIYLIFKQKLNEITSKKIKKKK